MKKKVIKTIGLVLLLAVLPMTARSQEKTVKPKRIYITLDVSGSMEGNKYIMANYAAQTIAVFSNENDQVFVYYLGAKHDISSANGYKKLQIPYNKHTGRSSYYEISDLTQFLKDYKANAQYQDWLFIIGDGDWNYGKGKDDFAKSTVALGGLIAQGDLQVCYLQTGNKLDEKYDFTKYLESLNINGVDIKSSDTTAASVLNNCVYFTNRILGFSSTNVKMNQLDGQTVTFCSEYPLERCLLVYQSRQKASIETKIVSTTCNEEDLSVAVKGNPSTKPLVSPGKSVLNGMVWELSSVKTIPSNDTVKVRFNQDIDIDNLKLYPYVDVALGMCPWSVAMDTLMEFSPNHFYICDKEDEALVKMIATDKYGHKFPPPLMQKMKVKMVNDSDTVDAKYDASDTSFYAVIGMPGKEMSYFSYVESPGYFSRISGKQFLVKNIGVCPPEKVPLITLPPQYFDAVRFGELKNGDTFGGVVDDTLFKKVVSTGAFDNQAVKDLNDYPYAEKVSFSQDSVALSFVQRPNSNWCECAYPDTLCYEVTLVSSKGIVVGDKSYEGFVIPVYVPVDKRLWAVRCKDYLILGIALVLFLVYLVAIKRKKRFKKNAKVTASYMELRGSVVRENTKGSSRKLRKKGFIAWLNRWLNPFGVETRRMDWSVPPAGSITFVAHKSKEKVNIRRSSFNSSKMRMGTFNIAQAKDGKTIEMTDSIKIYTGNKYEGQLTYESGGKDDEKKFRLFVVTLIFLSIMILGGVLFVLIKSLL